MAAPLPPTRSPSSLCPAEKACGSKPPGIKTCSCRVAAAAAGEDAARGLWRPGCDRRGALPGVGAAEAPDRPGQVEPAPEPAAAGVGGLPGLVWVQDNWDKGAPCPGARPAAFGDSGRWGLKVCGLWPLLAELLDTAAAGPLNLAAAFGGGTKSLMPNSLRAISNSAVYLDGFDLKRCPQKVRRSGLKNVPPAYRILSRKAQVSFTSRVSPGASAW